MERLIERVKEYMQNAVENGWDLSRWTAVQIADDMVECTGDFADCTFEELVQAITLARSI